MLRELYKLIYELINYMNVPLKVLTVFRNDSMACCFHWGDVKSYWKNFQNTLKNNCVIVLLEKANGL